MMKPAMLILTLVAGAAGIGCAVQPGTPAAAAMASTGRQCFRAEDVNGYSYVSDNLVDIQVGPNRYYRLSLDGWCPQSAFSTRVALKTSAGNSWICQGNDAEIIVPFAGGGPPQRCLINNVQPITKETWLGDRRRR
jgi:hypothetical protein